MPSSKTRYQLVLDALTRAGRGVELRTAAEDWLNSMLRNWAKEYKYPALRTIGTEVTLQSGSQFLDLPSDFGAGMDSCLIGTSGQTMKPIYETMADEFFQRYSLQGATNPAQGLPGTYMVDQSGDRLVFNTVANANYGVVPIYYKVPDDIPTGDAAYDSEKVWMSDDELVIQGLIELVYQYNGDPRELAQHQKVEAMKNGHRRGSVPPGGGVSRVLLSRKTFRRRSF